jgi:hypothetical protein
MTDGLRVKWMVDPRYFISLSTIVPCICAIVLLAAPPAVQASEPVTVECSKDAGPQAPRDILKPVVGTNQAKQPFEKAPPATEMNLCNIHFHKYAEHKATGFFTSFGQGANAGFVCDKKPLPREAAHAPPGAGAHASCQTIAANDTIEVHWVFTSCPPTPGPNLKGLANCTRCATPDRTPLLRVEAKVFHLSDGDGEDFSKFDKATSLPNATGAVEYLGSTTGADYDSGKKCSPGQVTWNVRPECSSLTASSLKKWCADNVFKEDEVHGVRPLVTEANFLSLIQK